MSHEDLWREIVSGRDRSMRGVLARAALLPLAWIYGVVITVYHGLYRIGMLRTVRLPCVTIGVGNLTVGGTGKSTTVRWLARRLVADGQRVAILSYGYHRKTAPSSKLHCREPGAGSREPGAGSREPVTVVSDGRRVLVPTSVSGDEPRMLAEALPGVPVLSGPRRVLSGARAVQEFDVRVLVLDDAFQYWRLEKDLEIVLVDAECPFGYGHLLPRGMLREPPRALSRADIVIVMNADRIGDVQRRQLDEHLARLAPGALRVAARRRPTALRRLETVDSSQLTVDSGERDPSSLSTVNCQLSTVPLDWLAGRRIVAVSSLGNPGGFVRALCDLGAAEVLERRFPDHHRYSAAEARDALRPDPPWEAVVTTAKDAPKLLEALKAVDSNQLTVDSWKEGPPPLSTVNCQLSTPVFVLEVDLDLGDAEATVLDSVRQRIGGSSNRAVAVE